jgi:RNA polymerase sigma-70 factor (ECF subfamily)
MIADPLDRLLEKLNEGDDQAAQEVFLAYEPYLRMVVRRLLPDRLRTKFDSIDVVQSVWADVLQGFRTGDWQFTNVHQLKAFLVKATRNRFIDRVRRHRSALEHERSLETIDQEHPSVAQEPRPADAIEAEELWERMLVLCPPDHREVLRLKRQGCSLDEIAAQTGYHSSSVRRILYDLARRLAATQSPTCPPSSEISP